VTLLTVDEVAERLGVASRTVWRWIDDGTLPAYRLGARLVRVREEDVETFPQRVDTTRRR
jgi:excisionase family DNA binding protein